MNGDGGIFGEVEWGGQGGGRWGKEVIFFFYPEISCCLDKVFDRHFCP